MEVSHFCSCVLILFADLFSSAYGGNRHYDFNQRKICDQAYGSVINSLADVPSSLGCASLCSDISDCGSCIYNPTSKVCSLNTHILGNEQTLTCPSQVIYAEKSLCVEGNACTYPLKNTRLCDGSGSGQCASSKGRLEVFLNNQWGTVCDDYWRDEFSAVHPNELVVCRMYGFTSGSAVREAYYGYGTGNILLDDVTCSGSETSILQCPALPIGTNNCNHSEDVGVSCY